MKISVSRVLFKNKLKTIKIKFIDNKEDGILHKYSKLKKKLEAVFILPNRIQKMNVEFILLELEDFKKLIFNIKDKKRTN